MRALSIKLNAILLLAGALRALAIFVVHETHVSWQYEFEEIAHHTYSVIVNEGSINTTWYVE